MKRGFTLLELVITLGLAIMIAVLVFSSFNSLNNREVLDKQVDFIEAAIGKARNDAINSKNDSDQSIVFATTTVTFDGLTTGLTSGISLASNSFATSTVTFYRITGFPSATGTLVYVFKKGNTIIATSSITINNLGIIE